MADTPDNTERTGVLGAMLERAKAAKLELDARRSAFQIAEDRFKDIKLEIKDELRRIGVDQTQQRGVANAIISTKTVPSVTDWHAFYEWVIENNMPELLQKRIHLGGFQELRSQGIEIPGVEDFELEDLTLKVLS